MVLNIWWRFQLICIWLLWGSILSVLEKYIILQFTFILLLLSVLKKYIIQQFTFILRFILIARPEVNFYQFFSFRPKVESCLFGN